MEASQKDYTLMYQDLGIDEGERGCIMLDVEPITVSDIILESDLYLKPDKPESHTQGNVSEKVPHVTLLYGLMQPGPAMKKHVDFVLGGIEFDTVRISNVGFFYGKEDNIVIIAEVAPTMDLVNANGELRRLPHIDTFADYRPHITLAYVKSSCDWQRYVNELNERLANTEVAVTGLNYGD